MFESASLARRHLWGLTLAAGDGRRLQPFVEQLRGEPLPKQFVNFIGRRSMLEHTFQRVERLIDRERLITIVSRHHLLHAEARRQLGARPTATIVVQPGNKETLPGILLPLMFVHRRCSEAIVALFPSDHFILEEDRFMAHVQLAFRAVMDDTSRLIMLAIAPRHAETEYGYIVPIPGAPAGTLARFGVQPVSEFVEKPRAALARCLVGRGGLWNTMTMVFKLKTFLALVRSVQPKIYWDFMRIYQAIESPAERQAIADLYQRLEPLNFSKNLIEKIAHRYPERISVLPISNVYWSDWGSSGRIRQTLDFLTSHRTQGSQEKTTYRCLRAGIQNRPVGTSCSDAPSAII
ncbi:MAG: sugar phosphate nucleotidyltransferase [Alphaproteobacteria bacterium]